MYYNELVDTMSHLLQEGKGILAADESTGTIAKRFATIGVDNTEENRRQYRQLLATTPQLNQYISGIILFEETFTQLSDNGKKLPEVFNQQGILPGIKVDKGLTNLANTDNEKTTLGLDDLHIRLEHFKQHGAKFAKWRNVYSISDHTPSFAHIRTGAENLARYAATCQNLGIVPIVEPEVLIDGDHSIEQCAEVSEIVLHELFHALFIHQVDLELIMLKPSMVTCGIDAENFSSAEDIANFTISVLRNVVPAAVPTINFLSGGQTPAQATENLNAINSIGTAPWLLSFSYGRALQEECLNAWRGMANNVKIAQDALLKRAHLNSLASLGAFTSEME